MHRLTLRAKVLGVSAIGAVAVALLLLVSALGSTTPSANAIVDTPTPTTGPTPTPKPLEDGNLSGVYDIMVHEGSKGFEAFHCILRLDHEDAVSGPERVKVAAVCNDNLGVLSDPNAEPLNDLPGEGPLADFFASGPPGPPPYVLSPPFKGAGEYDPGADSLVVTLCVPNQGGNSGPNIIARLHANDGFDPPPEGEFDFAPDTTGPKADLAADGKISAHVEIWGKQGATQCFGYSPKGDPTILTGSAINAHPVDDASPCPAADCWQVPWRGTESGIGAETGTDCAAGDTVDNDNDNVVNDGCPVGGPDGPDDDADPDAEKGYDCANDTSDEVGPAADALVNDGCPTQSVGSPDADWDNDGCSDHDELGKPEPVGKCGDDPYNPYDSGGTDFSGPYDLLVTVNPADACWNNTWSQQTNPFSAFDCNGKPNGTKVPGEYFSCIADIQQTGKTLAARASCYIDIAGGHNIFIPVGRTINPEASVPADAKFCPPAAPQYCGNSLPGSPPPGSIGYYDATNDEDGVGTEAGPNTCGNDADDEPDGFADEADGDCYDQGPKLFADIGATKHTVLTGQVNNGSNTMELEGCFWDEDLKGALGNVYTKTKIDAHTGRGYVSIWVNQTLDACDGVDNNVQTGDGTPAGAANINGIIEIVRQPPGPKANGSRDNDLDGCPDKKELGDNKLAGGLRDPANSYDYFNPTKDGLNRVDDIVAVVQQYFIDDPEVDPAPPAGPPYIIDYSSNTDRTGILGSSTWNLGPPNGQQRIDDIVAAVKAYFHDCS